MNRVAIFGVIMSAAAVSIDCGAARAQDFTAGKTPAQLFASDCSGCHRTPGGLAKNRDRGSLAGFLREHYTTKPENAGALASYVAGFAGGGPAEPRERGRPQPGSTPGAGAGLGAATAAAPATERPPGALERRLRRDPDAVAPGDEPSPRAAERRPRRDPEAVAPGDEPTARMAAKPADELPGRRRRATNLSGDGEKTSTRSRNETVEQAPRPPGSVGAPPAVSGAEAAPRDAVAAKPGPNGATRQRAKPADEEPAATVTRLNEYAKAGEGVAIADPIARMRAYAISGASPEDAAADAAKSGAPKAHRRHETAIPVPSDAVPTATPPASAAESLMPSANAPTEPAPAPAAAAHPQ